ncbi:hypothetical protein QUF80_17695 [Desulfococcaceae bacterium HSG8]|nr:hypothetical protein [Desulfococcaceae bacterium HSG8]
METATPEVNLKIKIRNAPGHYIDNGRNRILAMNRRRYDLFLRLAAMGQKFIPEKERMIFRLSPQVRALKQNIRPIAKDSFIRRWKRMEEG